ncbi:MAG: BatA and WFA domain-containing protein, partial [Nanoarchaeota archaeon]|nr:BatA and WFA domain-containing protein [Nanoarchaeota archaeon]
MAFDNLIGLYTLLAIAPFILIYLIRPKSFERVIPSLMFIMEEKHNFQKASFLQKLLRNLLFLTQLTIILFLAFSVAAPYLEIPHTVFVKNNIIVLDVSASMQAKDGISTRFSKAQAQARDSLGMKNTIILAANTPIIIAENIRSGEAIDIINRITPKATTSNLGDAILLAADLLGDEKGVVTVISDFMITEGYDLLMAKRSLTAKDNSVNFIDVSNSADNVGITNIIVDKEETTIEIKNYKEEETTFKVILKKDNSKIDTKEFKLSQSSKETIIFETLSGLSEIILDVNDDLAVDNTAYISTPQKKDFKVLLITNIPENNKIKAVLNALGVDLEIRQPPTVNAYNVDHDIVIIDQITKKLFVPTDFADLKKYVEKGGTLIMAAQEDLGDIDTLGLLPLTITGKEEKAASACVDIIGRIFPKDPFADEPCFTSINKHLQATSPNNTIKLVSSSPGNSPIISYTSKGLGQIAYYGIIDKYSNFYSNPFYPVFWNNLINFLMKTEDIREY